MVLKKFENVPELRSNAVVATIRIFGPFRLDVEAEILFRGAEPLPLGKRAVALLRLLVERPGAPVSKDALIAAAWSGSVVEDSNLPVQIAALRRVFGQVPGGERWIETLPRRGYRFVGPVVNQENAAPRPETALALPDKPSIAVLPFVNMSGDPEQEYFADGIIEDIITALSRSRWLFVIARNSSFTYKGRTADVKQVARELGVRYVLEGSVRKGGGRVRITAQLIDALSGVHRWADRYDREVVDIFALQDEITGSVAATIEPALAHAEQQRALRKPPESLDVWEIYQRGLWHLYKYTADENQTAQSFFRRAMEIDPNFAPGHYGFALAQHLDLWLYSPGPPPWTGVAGAGLQEARMAVSLDDKDSMAHAVLSFMRQVCGDWEAAIVGGRIAISLNPNSIWSMVAVGHALGWGGHQKEGVDYLRRAMRASPHDPLTWLCMFWIGIFHYFSGEYVAAVDSMREVIPARPAFAYRWLAAGLAKLGRIPEAKQAMDRSIAASPALFKMLARQRPPWMRPEDHQHMVEGLRKAGWEG